MNLLLIHLVVHEIAKVGTLLDTLLQLGMHAPILLLEQAIPNIQVPLNPLQVQHLLVAVLKNAPKFQHRVHLPDRHAGVDPALKIVGTGLQLVQKFFMSLFCPFGHGH